MKYVHFFGKSLFFFFNLVLAEISDDASTDKGFPAVQGWMQYWDDFFRSDSLECNKIIKVQLIN
jgi:hypothetical protein